MLPPSPHNLQCSLENVLRLLGNLVPGRFQNGINDFLPVREGNEETALLVSSSTELRQNLVPLGHIRLTIPVDENHATVVGTERPNLIRRRAVQAGRDNRVIAILKAEVLHTNTLHGHLETVLESLIADTADEMLITELFTVCLKLLLMLPLSHFLQVVPLNLLMLGVIPVAERDVELVAGKTSFAESAVNSASVWSNENFTLINKADRGVIHRIATIELRSQPHEVESFFLVELRENRYHTRIHPDRVDLQILHAFANHFFYLLKNFFAVDHHEACANIEIIIKWLQIYYITFT